MSKPVCSANSAVDSNKLSKIQEMAERAFTEAKPIRDKEILSEKDLKLREAAVCKTVGGDCLRLHHYAERVANAIIPPTGLQVRTEANIVRLFASKRISAKEIAGIVQLAEDRDRITAFRIPGDRIIKLHVGTWHAGPHFVHDECMFLNLENEDTNTRDFQDVKLPQECRIEA